MVNAYGQPDRKISFFYDSPIKPDRDLSVFFDDFPQCSDKSFISIQDDKKDYSTQIIVPEITVRQLIIHNIDQVFLFLGLPFFRVMTALASRGATGRNAIPPQRSVLDAVNVGEDLWSPNLHLRSFRYV